MLLGCYSEKIKRLVLAIDDSVFLDAVNRIEKLRAVGGKLILVGNGGSASICGHLAVDFTKSAKIRAVSFSDPALLTCFGNDYGYESAYAEMIAAYGDTGDILIAISSSGNSGNIINATQRAVAQGISVITLSGFSPQNKLRNLGDVNFFLNASHYNLVESGHEQILLALCDYLRMGGVAFEDWLHG